MYDEPDSLRSDYVLNVMSFLSRLFEGFHLLRTIFCSSSSYWAKMYHSSFPSLLFLIGSLAIAPAQAATYWVDPSSCSGKITAGDAITTEALNFAARAGVRNARGSADTNQAAAFQRLFMVAQSDPTIITPPSSTTKDEVQCESLH